MNRFFCFYTSGPYALMARKCRRSFEPYMPVKLIELKTTHDWMGNCRARAVRLNHLAMKHPNDGVGLLDSDLQCLKNPEILINFGAPNGDAGGDVAVHDLTGIGRGEEDRNCRYSAGVICFAPTELGRACLDRWAQLCIANPEPDIELPEQVYLYTAIREGIAKANPDKRIPGLKVLNIRHAYNRPFDEATDGDDTVILHKVASRKLKALVNEPA